ncbi:MAG: FadR/GntR family transcriptional regulator [Desulfobacteraceae bacterium]|nr:FadR/GntR family transcriptional regulator [Desulfobacteraceae bacterium]
MTEAAPLLKPLNKTKLHEEIVDQLKSRIIRRDISPGEKIPTERALAEILQVNRSTVREALRKLESLDLVEIRHGDGVYVKDYLESGSLELVHEMLFKDGVLDPVVFQNLLDLRRLLVPEMAWYAAQNRTEADLQGLENIVFRSDETIGERDKRLHHIIARASGNVLFVLLLNAFTRQAGQYYDLYFKDDQHAAESKVFHKAVYEAIRDKDADRARQVMTDALNAAEKNMLKLMK